MKAAPLTTALTYTSTGRAIFPCAAGDKKPLIEGWPNGATRDTGQVEKWWRRWPRALIGCPTGLVNGFVVLDVDLKDARKYGLDTLADLGFAVLPTTPMAHTRSGGLHLYFQRPAEGLRNTAGSRGRGIGPGCDWRGDGGFVILPSPESGYWWDPLNFNTAPHAAVPAALLPREPKQQTSDRPVKPETGLSAYAEAALDSACRRIASAPNGEQRDTLNAEAFAIGTLAGAGAIPLGFARRALLWAAHRIPSYDPRRPWRPDDIEKAVAQAFEDGCARPRGGCHGPS